MKRAERPKKTNPQLKGPYFLFVERSRLHKEELETLLSELTNEFKLPPYQTRQALIGVGPALLSQGEKTDLQSIANKLNEFGLRSSIFSTPQPPPKPLILKGLERSGKTLILIGKDREVRVDTSASVLALLSDISGQALKDHVSSSLSGSMVTSNKVLNVTNRDKVLKSVFRGKPILDIYLLNKKGQITDLVRAIPGKFNPDGLEDLRQSSTTGNIQSILRLLKKGAGQFVLRPDFGFARIPGISTIKQGGGHMVQEENLNKVVLFGSMMVSHVTHLSKPVKGSRISEKRESEPTILPPPPTTPTKSFHVDIETFIAFITVGAVIAINAGFGGTLFRSAQGTGSFLKTIIVTGLLPIATGLWLLGRALFFLKLKREIENTPTSKIRSMAMGTVELTGKAHRKYALFTPQTMRPCVWYSFKKYRRVRSPHTGRGSHGTRSSHWRLTHHDHSGHVPFILNDGTGEVLIDPANALFFARTKDEGSGSMHGGMMMSGNSSEKWVEESIPEGSHIYILGHARPYKDEQSQTRLEIAEKMRKIKSDEAAMKAADLDGDGQISPAEWDQARKGAEETVLYEKLNNAPKGPQTVVEKSPIRSRPFVIAEAQEDIVRGMKMRRTIFFLATGIAATIWGLFNLVTYLLS